MSGSGDGPLRADQGSGGIVGLMVKQHRLRERGRARRNDGRPRWAARAASTAEELQAALTLDEPHIVRVSRDFDAGPISARSNEAL
jgi:hypothetical protein